MQKKPLVPLTVESDSLIKPKLLIFGKILMIVDVIGLKAGQSDLFFYHMEGLALYSVNFTLRIE